MTRSRATDEELIETFDASFHEIAKSDPVLGAALVSGLRAVYDRGIEDAEK